MNDLRSRPARSIRAVEPRAVEPRPGVASAMFRDPKARWILHVLVGATIAEVLLLRVFFRVGVFIPKEGTFRSIHAALVALGTFAFNLASVLAFLALGWLALDLIRRGRRAVGTVLALFCVGSLLALAGPALGPAVHLTYVVAIVMLAWPAVRWGGRTADTLAIGAVAVALLLSAYSGMVADPLRPTWALGSPPGAAGLQLAGELIAALSCFAFLAARRAEGPLGVGAVILGALPAVALLAAWKTNGAVTGILVLWTAGFRLFLPMWIYVAALWALGITVAASVGDGTGRAAGLVLLVASGFLVESTYAQALALLAIALIMAGPRPERRRSDDRLDRTPRWAGLRVA